MHRPWFTGPVCLSIPLTAWFSYGSQGIKSRVLSNDRQVTGKVQGAVFKLLSAPVLRTREFPCRVPGAVTTAALCLAVIMLAHPVTSMGATRTWNGAGVVNGGGTDLNTGANWSGGSPGTSDDAVINFNDSANGDLNAALTDASAFSVQNLTISNSLSRISSKANNDSVTFSAAVTLSSNLVVAATGGANNYTLNVLFNSTATLLNGTFNGATKSASAGVNTTATLTFGGTTSIKSNLTFNGNTGLSTLNLNGTTTIGSNLTFIGGAGTNVLNIAGATTVTNNFLFGASSATTASNLVLVTGNLRVLGTLSVTNGNSGNSFTIANDSTISSLSVTGNLTDTYFSIVNADLVVSNSLLNLGKIDVANLGVLNVVRAFTNISVLSLNGGTLTGGNLTNLAAGTLFGSGVVSNLLVNSGIVSATNGELRLTGPVSGAGTYRAVAGASASTLTFVGNGSISSLFNTGSTVRIEGLLTNTSVFANRGSLAMAGGTYQSGNMVSNGSGFFVTGWGTVDAPITNLSGGTVTASNGTLTVKSVLGQSGTFSILNGATLSMQNGWQNAATLSLLGGTLAGANLTNLAAVVGFGAITSAITNSSGGTVTATNGELRLQGAYSGVGVYRAVAGASASTLTFAGNGSTRWWSIKVGWSLAGQSATTFSRWPVPTPSAALKPSPARRPLPMACST